MKKIALIFSLVLLALPVAAKEERVAGPDGRLVVTVSDEGGKPTYSVTYDGVAFVAPSPLGLKADIGDFTAGLALTGFAREAVADDYSVPTIKASTVHYRANRGVFSFAKDGKPAIDIIFQVSANDIAFRYKIYPPKPDTGYQRHSEGPAGMPAAHRRSRAHAHDLAGRPQRLHP